MFLMWCVLPDQDTNKVLAISRIMVAWQPVGIACGVFDMCKRYVGEYHLPLQSPLVLTACALLVL